ncbi:hypothetical protein MZO44_16790, partial [Lactiplantibacillus sp. E932]|nr:hypothetical protein [Lactiplantibacillus sp. E932]
VILQLEDTAGFVATLLYNASLPYQLGVIFKCKVSHLSFLGRFWRKETQKRVNISLGVIEEACWPTDQVEGIDQMRSTQVLGAPALAFTPETAKRNNRAPAWIQT